MQTRSHQLNTTNSQDDDIHTHKHTSTHPKKSGNKKKRERARERKKKKNEKTAVPTYSYTARCVFVHHGRLLEWAVLALLVVLCVSLSPQTTGTIHTYFIAIHSRFSSFLCIFGSRRFTLPIVIVLSGDTLLHAPYRKQQETFARTAK